MYESETWDILVSNYLLIKVRATKGIKSTQHPIGVSFAVMGYCFKETLTEVVRIDNSPHKGFQGTHVHFMNRERPYVEYNTSIKNPEQAIDFVEYYLKTRYPELL